MSRDTQRKQLEKIRHKTVENFGLHSSVLGSEKYTLNVVPSPSLMLDFKLGRGGFPYGGMVEVFGGNGLGKTTCIGYGTLANVQRQGKLPALIAMEPNWDADWAFKLHGLDPDLILVQRPDNVQEAFAMLYDLVYETDIDYILVDSIGAMGDQSVQGEDVKTKAYGVSGAVTSGLNAIMPRLFKSNKGLMLLNQQRQGSGGTQTWYESPGGEALKHHALVRIQLKPGDKKYKAKIDGKDVLVGRELKCVFKKNKMAQAASKSAEFDFYNIESEDYGILGVDRVSDVIKTAKVAGVIKGSSWLEHQVFPKGKVQGIVKARKFFQANPEAFDVIRSDVMAVMIQNELLAAEANGERPALKVVEA
jgi:recombination protein RecA